MPGLGNDPIDLKCSIRETGAAIKETVLQHARDYLNDLLLDNPGDCPYELKHPNEYRLKIVGLSYYLMKENVPLHRVQILQVCNKTFVTPRLELIEIKSDSLDEAQHTLVEKRLAAEVLLDKQVNMLIGFQHLAKFLSYENDEILHFRRKLTKARLKFLEQRKQVNVDRGGDNEKEEMLPQYKLSEPMPLDVAPSVIVICHLPDDDNKAHVKVPANPSEPVSKLLGTIFRRFARVYKDLAENKTVADYVLKVFGRDEFLVGDSPLIDYDYIRVCIGRNIQIELSLIPKSTIQQALNRTPLEEEEITLVDVLLSQGNPESLENEPTLSIYSLKQPFRVRVTSVKHIATEHLISSQPETEKVLFFVMAEVHFGGNLISDRLFTNCIDASSSPRWNQWLTFSTLPIQNIPRGSRILFTLYKRDTALVDPSQARQRALDPKDVPLGWVNRPLISHLNTLRDGQESMRLWPNDKANYIGTTCENMLDSETPVIFIDYETHGRLVVFPPDSLDDEQRRKARAQTAMPTFLKKLDFIIKLDPLTPLTDEDKKLLWKFRYHIMNKTRALPKFLLSVNWCNHKDVQEVHSMLKQWEQPTPLQAIQLLDARFADPVVREYACERLNEMGDPEMESFILQLTQILKYEPGHYSALARLLLGRALRNSKIGHTFFWHLKAEMHLPEIAERLSLLMEGYLRGCGNVKREELLKQNTLLEDLVVIANKVKTTPSGERKAVLHSMLERMKFPKDKFQLPLDTRWVATHLRVPKCKYMDSKKLPLWLVFENEEKIAAPHIVIFKVGDDLRQDVLTLQVIRIMDKMWKAEGMDLRLKPYGCVATGDEIGMIEVVLNSDTAANINKAAGGAKAVLYKDTLTKWLRQKNPTEQEFKQAQENFAYSCAGYCVATYVLGIGDRHNDNIMLTEAGHLFHIDFGHFLGNYKSKFGIKRERAPFVFTPQFAHVLGGKRSATFKLFLDTCCLAYNVLRKHSDTFITLFQLMLCGGIPELQNEDDILYMRSALAVGESEDAAAKSFTQLVFKSLKTKTTVVNDMIHVFVHS